MSLLDAPTAGPPATPLATSKKGPFYERHDRSRAPVRRDELRSASRRAVARRRRLALGRPGPALPRHVVGLFRGELRLRPPAPHRRDDQAGAAPRRHLARVLQRPAAALPREALP